MSGGGAPALYFTRYRAQRIRQRLLTAVDRLLTAIERRDAERVWALLDDPEAYRCIPANVREEAIAMAQLPVTSLRAPIRLYRYQHLLHLLGDEPIEPSMDLAQLSIDFAPVPPSGVPTAVRELPFADRRSPCGGPRDGGDDRRRSGSR